jgi:hypothetical protein
MSEEQVREEFSKAQQDDVFEYLLDGDEQVQ